MIKLLAVLMILPLSAHAVKMGLARALPAPVSLAPAAASSFSAMTAVSVSPLAAAPAPAAADAAPAASAKQSLVFTAEQLAAIPAEAQAAMGQLFDLRAAKPGELTTAQRIEADKNAAPDAMRNALIDRLSRRFKGTDDTRPTPGEYEVSRGVFKDASTGGEYHYRVLFALSARDGMMTLRRTVDYAYNTWSAERMLDRAYEKKAEASGAKSEDEIREKGRQLMIADARADVAKWGAEELRRFDEDMGPKGSRRAMTVWRKFTLNRIMQSIELDVDLSRGMDELAARVDLNGDKDLFGKAVESFASVQVYPVSDTHGPYTNIYVRSDLRVSPPKDAGIRAAIVDEIERFVVSNAPAPASGSAIHGF